MFVINVTCHIMDIQIIQHDVIYRSVVFRNAGNTGSVHRIRIVICFVFFGIGATLSVIGQFQTVDLDILGIFN